LSPRLRAKTLREIMLKNVKRKHGTWDRASLRKETLMNRKDFRSKILKKDFRSKALKNKDRGLGCSSVVQNLPSMRKALGLIPAPKKKRLKKKKNKDREKKQSKEKRSKKH
jgi:hypothetical protein